MSEGGWLAKTAALASKDFRIEARGRDTLPPMLAFSLTVTLLLTFTIPVETGVSERVRIPGGAVAVADVLSGFLWITVLFAGLIGFARTFEVERDEDVIDSLLLAPLDRSGLFVAKAVANLVFLAAVEVFLVPLFVLFFSLELGSRWPVLVLVIALVDLGFVAVGTLFSALAAQTRSRELILPLLALPALVPVFIAGVELTSDLFVGGSLGRVAGRGWFGILIVFDVIFATVGALVFEFALD